MTRAHPSKRQYLGSSQPSITSYFSPSLSSSTNITSSCASSNITSYPSPLTIPPPLSSPPLPATVQSNLLSVGMRIRKSVPEGYKTGSTYSAFTLFSDNSPISPRTPVPFSNLEGLRNGGSGRTEGPAVTTETSWQNKERITGRARARELTPFCGVLKVGGLGVQEMDMEGMGVDDVPPLSSQGSTATVDSAGGFGSGNSNKRRWDFEDEEAEEEERGRERKRDDGVVVLGGVGQGFGTTDRVIAVPKKMRMSNKMSLKDDDAVVKIVGDQGQENLDVGVDFGEADFLDYRLVVGAMEVEMSGV